MSCVCFGHRDYWSRLTGSCTSCYFYLYEQYSDLCIDLYLSGSIGRKQLIIVQRHRGTRKLKLLIFGSQDLMKRWKCAMQLGYISPMKFMPGLGNLSTILTWYFMLGSFCKILFPRVILKSFCSNLFLLTMVVIICTLPTFISLLMRDVEAKWLECWT